MNRRNKLLLIIAFMWVSAAVAQPDIHVARFWGDRQAALSYTFDDGLLEHYTEVFPRLRQLGLKASFCIIGSKVGRDQKGTPCMTWQQLREMAADGQEISSHGFRHQSMEKLTGEALRYEVQHNDTLIYHNVGVFPRTYFFPGNRKTDEGLAFTKRDRVGVRDFQTSLGSKRDSLWVLNYVSRLLKKGEWGVTMTHGITTGYDAFADPQLLWSMLEQTAAMQDRLWIATLHDVSAYVAERDTIQLKTSTDKHGVLNITPVMPLDQRIFHHPLTLVVKGRVREVRQGGKILPLSQKGDEVLFDFDPHGGKLYLSVTLPH